MTSLERIIEENTSDNPLLLKVINVSCLQYNGVPIDVGTLCSVPYIDRTEGIALVRVEVEGDKAREFVVNLDVDCFEPILSQSKENPKKIDISIFDHRGI